MDLYALGTKQTVIVDDYLPYHENYNGEMSTYFNLIPKDGAMWMSILEKAFAKFHGNYSHLDGGNQMVSIATLAGMPSSFLGHKEMMPDDLWKKMTDADKRGDVIQTGTNNGPGGEGDSDANSDGLSYGHAYTVLGVKQLDDGTRLVKIRNPWGAELYKGKFSDSSGRWTKETLKEAGHTQADDGVFFMLFSDYMA